MADAAGPHYSEVESKHLILKGKPPFQRLGAAHQRGCGRTLKTSLGSWIKCNRRTDGLGGASASNMLSSCLERVRSEDTVNP